MRDADDPRCPECGEPIGMTATYCMHCSADLTDELEEADGDGRWNDSPEAGQQPTSSLARRIGAALGVPAATGKDTSQLLDPDGFVDDALTAIVGVVGGIVVGAVGTIVLGAVTGNWLALVMGLLAWLGSTVYLVRRRTVQGAIAASAYAVAVVLVAVPVIALSPVVSVDGGYTERGGLFFVLLLFVAVPVLVALAVGWIASRFVPTDS